MVRKIKVLIVDDSNFMRMVLRKILLSDPVFDVIGDARDGLDAVEKVKELHPDVVTMDVNMPRCDGIEAVKILMKDHPTRILMISAHTKKDSTRTIEALSAGAIDFIEKKGGEVTTGMEAVRNTLIQKIKFVAAIPIENITAKRKKIKPGKIKPGRYLNPKKIAPVVAIGISTGGPKTLESVLPLFDRNFPATILVVQHIPEHYSAPLAARLNDLSDITVREAKDKDYARRGVAYFAPGDRHITISSARHISVQKTPMHNGFRPSVDVLFHSVARNIREQAIGVLLTGMGKDGAEGLLEMKKAGAITIAQDEESSVIYGMPKVAREIGAADVVLPVEAVTPFITSVCSV